MTKHFTFMYIGQKYNRATKRWSNEYAILRDNEWYGYCGCFITGYKNAVSECRRLEKFYKNKGV